MIYTDGHEAKLKKSRLGVPKVVSKASCWLQSAAEQVNARAQSLLDGNSRSDGVPEDVVRAYMWWNLAAAQGDEIAIRVRATLE
jgi:TPR repeat protein